MEEELKEEYNNLVDQFHLLKKERRELRKKYNDKTIPFYEECREMTAILNRKEFKEWVKKNKPFSNEKIVENDPRDFKEIYDSLEEKIRAITLKCSEIYAKYINEKHNSLIAKRDAIYREHGDIDELSEVIIDIYLNKIEEQIGNINMDKID